MADFNVRINGQNVRIKAGEKIEDIKTKLGNPEESIFSDIDKNGDGTLDANEMEAFKKNLENSDYEVSLAADGRTPKTAYNQAMQNLRNSYDTEELKGYYKSDDTYTIKKGDTLYEIAKKQLEAEGLPTDDYRAINNRIAQIANLNNLNDVNRIPVGTELIIKLTDEAIKKVKEDFNNDTAKAFEGDSNADGDDWTSYGPTRGRKSSASEESEASFTGGIESTITATENGLNMGKGKPVDKDGNELKDFSDPKYQEGGAIMKYQQGDKVMYQTSYTSKGFNGTLLEGLKLSAPTIEELKKLKSDLKEQMDKIKPAQEGETEEAKATRMATNLEALKKLVTLTNGNVQMIKNVAEKLRGDDYVDKKSDGYKEFVQDLLLTRNADVVGALTTNAEGKVDMSIVENDRTANEYLAGMYQEIREKEKAGEKLTADEVKLKDVLVNTMNKDGFKIDADEAKQVNEKWLNYNDNGELYYATYVDNVVYWASDEKLLDEFVNKLKAADTDEKKAALFKEYAKTKDVELARCLLAQAKVLKAKDEDIKTVINANGMNVLAKLDRSDNSEWSDDIKNTMLARIKDIYTKDKGNLENAYYLGVADDWIDKLPENEREKARTEIAETYFKKTTTKDENGNDKVEYKFNPKRRPTKEEMEGLCKLGLSDDMKAALVKYVKLEDMGAGQYTEVIDGLNSNAIVPHYAEMVDKMTDKNEVIDFIDNKIVANKNSLIPFDKILEKFPDDKDIKDRLMKYVDDKSTISEDNAASLINTLGKADIEKLKILASHNTEAVRGRLAELVKANTTDQTFIQQVCNLNGSITPYQALYEVDANKAKWDDKTKQAVFEKIFNNRIKIKDIQKYLDGAVKSGLATKMAEDRYIVGSNIYTTDGWNDTNKNDKFDNDDTMSLRKMSKASYDNGAKLYDALEGAGSGYTKEMLKGEGNYKNFVTADNVAGLIQGFNDKSPNEGVMQYIANEWATIPQATCNVIPNKLMEKATALELTDSKEYKDLDEFVKKHTDTTRGYSEDEGKQLDALINALAVQVSFKS